MAAFIATLITACSSQPERSLPPAATASKSVEQRLAAAARLSPVQRASQTLQITRELLTADPARTEKILEQLPYEQLPQPIQAQLAVQQAQIAHLKHRYWAVFDWLDREAVIISNDPTINAHTHTLKALAYERFGEYPAALDEWLQANLYLSQTEQASYYDDFWQTLLNTPPERLSNLSQQETSPVLKGWFALALIYQNDRNLDHQLTSLEQWKQKWADHPAQKYLPNDFLALQNSPANQPNKIAVLLPLSGRLNKVGEAVRDGILASHYEAMANRSDTATTDNPPLPELQFYDTENANINDLATQAVTDGAQLIIGPLSKNLVNELGNSVNNRPPVLALNYIDSLALNQPGFYQFGLSGEDEARFAAERARLDGHTTALVITPKTEWGKKVYTAFKTDWEALGGYVVGTAEFDDTTQFSKLTGQLLHTNQSEARHQQLNRLLEENLGFAARRRQDVDMVFIGANPQEARQIKPALNYQYAGNIPVYATSSAFSGSTNTSQDQDMDGVRVPVMPWLIPGTSTPLEKQINALWQHPKTQLGTLYALGADAYRLYPRLRQLISLQGSQVQGLTGSLSITPDGKVHRQLIWQVFKNGRLRPLPTVPKNS